MQNASALLAHFNPVTGTIAGASTTQRHLSDLQGVFADAATYEAALATDDALIYTVSLAEPAQGQGQLHYGLGTIMPGRIGNEYYLTKGHYHAWRPAAEVYIGRSGEGMMLLQDEHTQESTVLPLAPDSVVYVPGFAAHRTINTGNAPLTYLGIYPAQAGHDYQAIADRNFRKVVVTADGKPTLVDRATFLDSIKA